MDWLQRCLQWLRPISLPIHWIHSSSQSLQRLPWKQRHYVPPKQHTQNFYPTWFSNPEDYHFSYTNRESLKAYMNVIIYTILEMLTFFRLRAHLSRLVSLWLWQLSTLPVNVWSSLRYATTHRDKSRPFRGWSSIYQHLSITPRDTGEAFCITCNGIWHHTKL